MSAKPTNWIARRLLVVAYDMTDGRTDVVLEIEDVRTRANQLGVARMTDDDFEAYRSSTVARVKALRASTAN